MAATTRRAPGRAGCAAGGAGFALVSPLRADLPAELGRRWYPLRPGHRHRADARPGPHPGRRGPARPGVPGPLLRGLRRPSSATSPAPPTACPRTPPGPPPICGHRPPPTSARWPGRWPRARTLVTVTWSLQRIRHGEQPVWAGDRAGRHARPDRPARRRLRPRLRLDGQHRRRRRRRAAADPAAGRQPGAGVHPGGPDRGPAAASRARATTTTASAARYPDIRLVYWAGGNPFHHHQDLSRLRRAFGRPDTIVVHEPYWTATARHADIVLPVTTTLEREDIGAGAPRPPPDRHAPGRSTRSGRPATTTTCFAASPARLGVGRRLHRGPQRARVAGAPVRPVAGPAAPRRGHRAAPASREFWAAGQVELPAGPARYALFERFRADPRRHRAGHAERPDRDLLADVAGFGYADCPGHPAWLEPRRVAGRRPRAGGSRCT